MMLAEIAFAGFALDSLLDNGDKIGSIVGGGIALGGAVLGGVLWGIHTIRHKRLWDNALSLCYLIPCASYPARSYAGAPLREEYPDHLSVGIGTYSVILRFEVKTEMVVDDAPWAFPGADGAVEDLGSENPFVVETITKSDGRIHWKDWHGQWHNAEGNGPLVYKPKMVRVGAHRIRTQRPYSGQLEVTFLIRGHDPIVRTLAFTVVDGEGDVPFLKETMESRTRTYDVPPFSIPMITGILPTPTA